MLTNPCADIALPGLFPASALDPQGSAAVSSSPSLPAAACNYSISGTSYECRGDGYMWDADSDDWWGDEHGMACPQCNTLAHLQEAKEEAQTCSSWANISGSGTGETIWLNAVKLAQEANPAATAAALALLGLVETLVNDKNQPDGYRVVPYLYN